jgi:TetR/AcrR family transcriptional regulator, cholesterol catabolism regulator
VPEADVVALDAYRGRDLNHRFGDVSRRACAATVALLREHPDITVSLRAVAARSGIHHRTLRGLFGSPDVLVAAACLERLRRAPVVIDFEQRPPERVRSQFVELLTPSVDEPGFALCCARVLTGCDPAVRPLRAQIDAELYRRLNAALGFGAWPELSQILHLGLVGTFITTISTSSLPPEIDARIDALISAAFPGGAGGERISTSR